MTVPIMPDPDNGDQKDYYWATWLYVQYWYAYDSNVVYRIKNNNGCLDADSFKRILIAYGVRRGFPDLKQNLQNIIDVYNSCFAKQPTDICERWEQCNRTAIQIRDKGLTRGRQISAATKISWFMQPAYWTPYDSLACAGMKCKDDKQFYTALKGAQEWDAIVSANKFLEDAKVPQIRTERIFDVKQMMASPEWSAPNVKRLQKENILGFGAGMNKHQAMHIGHLAANIQMFMSKFGFN